VKAGNPLYILVALEELRVFGKFEKLSDRVDQLPGNVAALFDQVLERIESDFNHELVRDCMSFIACGKQGMTAEELQTLLSVYTPQVKAGFQPNKLPDMLWARLCRAFGAYLFERSGVIDFFHGQLKEAVGNRYLEEEADRNATHRTIADYFESRWREPYLRALEELPHQRTKATDWDGTERILTDLHFIEAKCAAAMTYDLIADYGTALNALPEAQDERQKERKHQERVERYTKEMIEHAQSWNNARDRHRADPIKYPMPKRKDIPLPESIPSVELLSDEKIREDLKKTINNPTRMERLRAFSQFVNFESHTVLKFASYPGFLMQQAYNSADSGPVVSAAEGIVDTEVDHVLILQPPSHRHSYNPHPILIKTIEEHIGSVQSVSISPEGKQGVSGSSDNTLRLWDLESGECLRILAGHTATVSTVSITPNGKTAFSGSDDGTLRVWNLENGKCLKTLKGHTRPVKSVSVTPDGKKAVSGSEDKTFRVWDVITGECLKTLGMGLCWALSPVPSVSITSDGNRALSVGGRWNQDLQLWDIDSGKCLKTLIEPTNAPHEHPIKSICITPDGERALSASYDRTLRVWDLESGKCLKRLKGHEGSVECVSMTPDGKTAISGGGWSHQTAFFDTTLRVWDIEGGQCLKTIRKHPSSVTSVSITSDGKKAFSGSDDGTLRVWNLEGGESLRTAADQLDLGKTVSIACVTPDGKRAILTKWESSDLFLWDFENAQQSRTLSGHTVASNSVIMTSDGKKAISGGATHWHPLGHADKTLRVWDLESGMCLSKLEIHSNSITSISLTPDEKIVVSGGNDSTLRTWELESGIHRGNLTGHKGPITGVSITPDGRIAISGSEDKTLRIWKLEGGNCLRSVEEHTERVYSVSVTPDGKRIVSISDALRIYNLESGVCLKTLRPHPRQSWEVGVTPDGKRAISESRDHSLWIWDLGICKCLRKLEGHTDWVRWVRVAPDGKRAISGSHDNTVRAWNLDSGECIAIYSTKSGLASISMVNLEGHFLCSTDIGEVIFLRTRNLGFEPPLLTPTRIWLFLENGRNGRWEDQVKATCQWCRKRFPAANEILDVIMAIKRNGNLSPDQSPCLEFPAEVWEDPRLLSDCPYCHRPVRFNPFIVDNRGDTLMNAKIRYRFEVEKIDKRKKQPQRQKGPLHQSHRDEGAQLSKFSGEKREIGPIAPCTCGSGKKYKKCCGAKTSKVTTEERIPQPTPHPVGDLERAPQLNIEYQKELKKWKALPWWKRLKEKKPRRRAGI
jgi:WD40 repeat protein